MRVELEGGIVPLRALALKLDRLARTDLDAAIRKGITDAARPLPIAAAKRAYLILPHRGGLGALVAKTHMPVVIRNRTRRSGVLIRAQQNSVKDPAAINRGRVRHPVYGREPHAGPLLQTVRAGWFTDPMRQAKPEVREAIVEAINDVLKTI